MPLSLLSMPQRANIASPNTNANRKALSSKKHRVAIKASSSPNEGQNFDTHQFSLTLEQFKPTKLEKKQ